MPDGLTLEFLLPGRDDSWDGRPGSLQTSTRAALDSRVPKDYFRQVRQIGNSGLRIMGSNLQYDLCTLWQLAGQLMSPVVRIHDVRRDAPSVGH